MIRAETSVVINRSAEDISGFFEDLDNQAQWVSGWVEVRDLPEGPRDVGSKWTDVRQLFGRHVESTVEITVYEPNRKTVWKTTEGPVPAEATLTYEAVEDGTRLNYAIEAETEGFFKLADPLFGRMIQRQIDTDFSNLKDLLEA